MTWSGSACGGVRSPRQPSWRAASTCHASCSRCSSTRPARGCRRLMPPPSTPSATMSRADLVPAAHEPDEVYLAVHAEFGVDRRQVVADGALADVETSGNGGDALAVEQPGEHRPFTACELAEPRLFSEDGQLLEPGDEPCGVQFVGYPQHVRLQLHLARTVPWRVCEGVVPDERECQRR